MKEKSMKARVIDSVVVLIDERFSDTGYKTFSVGTTWIGGQKVADIIQDSEKNIFWVFDENEEIVAEIRDCPVVIYYKDAPDENEE